MTNFGTSGYGVLSNTGQASTSGFEAGGILDNLTNSGVMNQAAGSTAAFDPTWMQGLTGYTTAGGDKVNGWGGTALGLAQGAFGAYSSMQNYGLAKDQLSESKRQFDANYDTQRSLTNTAMSDRQAARVASNSSAYQSVDSYMNKNGV